MRKQGQTNKQYIRQLEAQLENSKANNTVLRQHLHNLSSSTDVMNPRTNRLYKDEAQELFNTVALTEMFIRTGEAENAVGMLYGQLGAMGFTEYMVMNNEALKDGAYDTKKSWLKMPIFILMILDKVKALVK